MTPEDIEHNAEAMFEAMRAVWEAEWARDDLALALLRTYGQVGVRLVCSHDLLNTSHRNVLRWASLAQAWPEHTRSPDASPRTHAKWNRRRECR